MKKLLLILILLPVFSFCVSNNVFAYDITKFTAQSLCASTFPTAFVAGSFFVRETTVGEFGINQKDKTMRFDVPAGWEYNSAGVTFSVTGVSANDITEISIEVTTATRITVRITTAGTAIDLNTITVSCQIRATAAGTSGIIRRSGGNFRIARSNKRPTASESLGDLSAQSAMAYTSSTVMQPNITSVSQGTIDNDIIRVEVVITGTCNVFNLTQFNFNTTGSTNPTTDNITTARVYYTGLTNTFSPTGLFGSVSLPNGDFSITGSQALTAGTNYFWLVFDVPGTATIANVLDAQCTSITMDGGVGTKALADANPAGIRTIDGLAQFYSRATGNWNDNNNWSNTDGGGSCSCQPDGSGNVFINTGHTITLNAVRTVNFVTVRNGALLIDNGSTLKVINKFNTLLSGRFAATSDWTVDGNMILSGTGASTTTRNFTVAGSSTIPSGTSLTENGAAGNSITLQGNLILDGILSSGTAGGTIIMNGASAQTISSSTGGTVSGTGTLTLSTSAKTIAALTTLSISPTVSITGAITVTNNGTVTLIGGLTGSAAGSTWTNADNSTLNTAGTLLATGTLTATASSNTVNYNSAAAQTVKTTSYNNLTISNAGTRTFQSAGTIGVVNILIIQDAAIFDVGTNTLSGAGGLTMTGTSELKIAKTATTLPELAGIYILTSGTVTLNQTGATTQTASGVPPYYNLKLDGGAGSTFNIAAVTDVDNNFDVINQSSIPSTGNGALFVGGIFTHSTSGTNNLSGDNLNDMIVTGSSNFSNGTFNANGRDFTTGSLILTGGTFIGGLGTTEITGAGGWTNNGGTYTNTSNTVLFSGTAEQTIGGTQATTFRSLTLNNSSGLSLNAVATVNNTLTFTSGIIKTNANRVIVGSAGSAGTVTRTSGHVNGNLRRFVPNASAPIVNYAIGDATHYTPVSITFVGTTSGSISLDASTSAIDPTFGALSSGSGLSSTKYIKRRWVVTNTNVGGFDSYSPTFTFVPGDIQGSASFGSLIIRKLDSTWTSTTNGIRTSTTTQATGLTSFGEFALGETGTTNRGMPLNLLLKD